MTSHLVYIAAMALLPQAAAPSPTPAPVSSPPRLYAVRLTTGPAWDAAKSPNDQKGMREHSANIARLRREGTLVHGARFGELGLLVFRLPDEAAVRKQLEPDPAIGGGVFKVQIDPFSPFAHGTTAWLMTPEAITLRAYFDAHNRGDSDGVAALLAPKAKWLSLDGDRLVTDGEGREALRTWHQGYFKSLANLRSEALSIEQTGPHLYVRERASWTAKDGTPRSQQSHSVYEIRDGLIQRVWYFPALKDQPPATK